MVTVHRRVLVKTISSSQQQHHLDNHIIRSPKLLLSQLQRKIWHIAWQLWEHRNLFLHDTNKSYHPQEIQAIDKEIRNEWTRGLDQLPQKYATLFTGTLKHKLQSSHRDKLKWLTSIWALTEMQQPNYFTLISTDTDPLTRYRYLKWKEYNT